MPREKTEAVERSKMVEFSCSFATSWPRFDRSQFSLAKMALDRTVFHFATVEKVPLSIGDGST